MEEQTDDITLMRRYGEGDVSAFETLYARYRGPLYRFLRHQCRPDDTAADVFQEVWSRVIAHRQRYEARASFRTWLYHIAHHCVIDHQRQRTRKRMDRMDTLDDHGATLTAASHEQPDAQAVHAQLQDSFQRALFGLPLEQRTVFVLIEESGLGLKDIAEVVGVPAETVKSRLRYALAKLRRELAGDFKAADLQVVRAQT